MNMELDMKLEILKGQSFKFVKLILKIEERSKLRRRQSIFQIYRCLTLSEK